MTYNPAGSSRPFFFSVQGLFFLGQQKEKALAPAEPRPPRAAGAPFVPRRGNFRPGLWPEIPVPRRGTYVRPYKVCASLFFSYTYTMAAPVRSGFLLPKAQLGRTKTVFYHGVTAGCGKCSLCPWCNTFHKGEIAPKKAAQNAIFFDAGFPPG